MDFFAKIRERFERGLVFLAVLISSSLAQTGLGQSNFPRELTIDLGGGTGMEFVLIQPGSFQMGSEKNMEEKPVHAVTIAKAFYIGKIGRAHV